MSRCRKAFEHWYFGKRMRVNRPVSPDYSRKPDSDEYVNRETQDTWAIYENAWDAVVVEMQLALKELDADGSADGL